MQEIARMHPKKIFADAKDLEVGQIIRTEYGDYNNFVNFKIDDIESFGDKIVLVVSCGEIKEKFAMSKEEEVEVVDITQQNHVQDKLEPASKTIKEGGLKMNIYEKLLTVQSMLKAPKSQFNKFGNYHYRNCEDIQEAVKPLLIQVKAALTVGDDLIMIGERYYIKATARFIDCESSQVIENTAYAREDLDKKGMDVSQVTGSTSSYARKYALNGLFCIDDVKDADNQDNRKLNVTKKTENPVNDDKNKVSLTMINSIKNLVEKYSSKGVKISKILAIYQIKDIADMSINQYRDCMEKLKLYEEGEKHDEQKRVNEAFNKVMQKEVRDLKREMQEV